MSPAPTRSLAVCISAYRRPQQLERLLRTLDACHAPENVAVEIRVVDNDPERSAEAVVSSLAGLSGLAARLRYSVEARPGVVHVRNHAIDLGPVDLVAFIDDDEWPEPTWLARLVAELDRSGVDAVIGPVLADLPDTAPAWLRRGRFRDAVCGPAGERAVWGAARTGNVLFRGHWFYERGLRFDPAFSRSGGEDAELFSRLDESGASFVCSDAQVWEHVPAERLTLLWQLRRQIRCGANYGRISSQRADAYPRELRVCLRAARLVGSCAVAVSPRAWRRPELAASALFEAAFLLGFIPALWVPYDPMPAV